MPMTAAESVARCICSGAIIINKSIYDIGVKYFGLRNYDIHKNRVNWFFEDVENVLDDLVKNFTKDPIKVLGKDEKDYNKNICIICEKEHNNNYKWKNMNSSTDTIFF